MELKVWVEGLQRIVCGITDISTCQDVVFALAHATGKTGRFTLIERWRNNERPLAPTENPLKILMKWGEYSSDVQFILQRTDSNVRHSQQEFKLNRQQENQQLNLQSEHQTRQSSLPNHSSSNVALPINALHKNVDMNTSSLNENIDNVTKLLISKTSPLNHSNYTNVTKSPILNNMRNDYESTFIDVPLKPKNAYRDRENFEVSRTNEDQSYNENTNASISSYGSLIPPPYRAPPDPTLSPMMNSVVDMSSRNPCVEERNLLYVPLEMYAFQRNNHNDLVQLIQFQKDKINLQQIDLDQYDAEIVYFENKTKEQLEVILQEINQVDHLYRQGYEQLQTLQYVEEESKLVKQQEKTLKSEILLLRSKLTNCETELQQCRNKICLLMDEIYSEQLTSTEINLIFVEKHLVSEIERTQKEIDSAMQNYEKTSRAAENFKEDISTIECAITDKKKHLEKLIHEMKEVNLQSLTAASSDEVKTIIETSFKPGSSRRIVGSPRQLESAVPTSKNPHGVWV